MSGTEATQAQQENVENNSVPEQIQDNLKMLMEKSKHLNGIWGSKFQQEYKKLFHTNLGYEEYGYGSLEHILSKLTYICKVVKHFKGDFKVFAANSKVPMNGENMTLKKEDLKLRANAMQAEEVIRRQHLHATNNLISIKVDHIYDPSKFWFHSSEAEKQLLELMQQMKCFYTSMGKNYQIPSYQMKNKLYSAVLYDDMFQRSIIIDVLPELIHSVKVFFIDNGTVDTVFVRDVYFLHESFKEPPAMAMRGQIAFAKPCGLNMPWSMEAVALFEHLVQQNGLKAQVESITRDGAEVVYVMRLFDKTPHNGNSVQDQMIKRGFAINGDGEQDKSQSIPEFINNTQAMHLVPTFQDLERGLAPTRYELKLLRDIYPAHKLFQKYIKTVQ